MASPAPNYFKYRLTAIPSKPDPRDYPYRLAVGAETPDIIALIKAGTLPTAVDLHAQGKVLDPKDQGQEGACTGFCEAEGMENSYLISPVTLPESLSPAYVYYAERQIEGDTNQDAGAEPRDGLDALVKRGVCRWSLMPYVAGSFNLPPSAEADADAQNQKAARYEALAGWQWICQALGAERRLVMVAGPWFNEWFNPAGGVIPLVNPSEPPAGGHCYGICGYKYSNVSGQWVLYLRIHNSWGGQWGDGTGHAFIQADKIDQYLWERWVVYSVAEVTPQPQPQPQPVTVPEALVAGFTLSPSLATLIQRSGPGPGPTPNPQPNNGPWTAFRDEFVAFARMMKQLGADVAHLVSDL